MKPPSIHIKKRLLTSKVAFKCFADFI